MKGDGKRAESAGERGTERREGLCLGVRSGVKTMYASATKASSLSRATRSLATKFTFTLTLDGRRACKEPDRLPS